MIRLTGRTWTVALVALVAASAGLSTLSSGISTTSLVRTGVAAGVLSAYAAAAAIVSTRRADRTVLRCVLWGVFVPFVVGVLNAVLVTMAADAVAGLVSAAPWVLGAGAVSATGRLLPSFGWLAGRRGTEPDARSSA